MAETADYYLWLDFETTGLVVDPPNPSSLCEAAWVITDESWTPIMQAHSLIDPWPSPPSPYSLDPEVYAMHEKSGLLAALTVPHTDPEKHGARVWRGDLPSAHQIGAEILADCREIVPEPGKIMLAGSGVGEFDRPLLRFWMRPLDEHLSYRSLDLGPTRRFLRNALGPELMDVIEPERAGPEHRALDDVLHAIARGCAWRDLLAGLSAPLVDALRSAKAAAEP